MTKATVHPRTVAGSVAIRELRWLKRHAPESAQHCIELEKAIRREVRKGIEAERAAQAAATHQQGAA